MKRPNIDEYFVTQALLSSTRGTCIRRRTGCVLVDHNNHVLSSGYNGPPSGSKHCVEIPCSGAFASSGQGLERCEAVHAESNAIVQCENTQIIRTAYCTNSPCVWCVGLLMNTSCSRVVFLDEYAHDEESKRRWLSRNNGSISSFDWKKGRAITKYEWIKCEITDDVLAKVVDSLRVVQLPKNMETSNSG